MEDSGLVAGRIASCNLRLPVSLSQVGRDVWAIVDRVKDGYRNGISVPVVRAMMVTVCSLHTDRINGLALSKAALAAIYVLGAMSLLLTRDSTLPYGCQSPG